MKSLCQILIVAAWLAAQLGCSEPAKESLNYHQDAFNYCVSCHGEHGEGNPEIGAPKIAGLSRWYVKAQLRKFRDGIRGTHPSDLEGARMGPMARSMRNDENLTIIAEYVASLPPIPGDHDLQGGDAERGRVLFAPCVTCHGQNGEGNIDQRGPPLAGADDWYLLNQLKKFKAGYRGKHPQDVAGALMQPFALTLADEQQMKDVIAYIGTLPAPQSK